MHVRWENGLFRVVLADNEWSTAVALLPQDGAPAFAEFQLRQVASTLFNRLNNSYELYFRAGPWTSGKFAS
jgi:hypothetical protein